MADLEEERVVGAVVDELAEQRGGDDPLAVEALLRVEAREELDQAPLLVPVDLAEDPRRGADALVEVPGLEHLPHGCRRERRV